MTLKSFTERGDKPAGTLLDSPRPTRKDSCKAPQEKQKR